jgi:hypothetical protein
MPTAPHITKRLAACLLAMPAQSKGDGLWLTYTGAVVCTAIEGLNGDEPIRLVIDLATLSLAGPEIPALAEHQMPVGKWLDTVIDPVAPSIIGRLKLLDTPPESRGLPMFDAALQLRLSMQQGQPWQASIRAEAGEGGGYEMLTQPTVVNGAQVELAADMPTYVLRGGVLKEKSIVLFGADDRTMQVAASATALRTTHHLESTMSDDKKPTIKERLDAHTAKLGAARRPALAVLLAEGCTDEEVSQKIADEDAAAMKAQLADLTTKLEAATKLNAELTEKLAALAPEGGKTGNDGTPSGAANLAAGPKTLMQAQLMAKDADGKPLRGFAALNWARANYPHLATPQPAA